jgi:hypothetical protein
MTEESFTKEITVPKKVFIIPYRNRPEQKLFFTQYMKIILEHAPNDYEIYFSHQADERSFNRGAMKNIGFLAVKQKYPNHYQDINFIFHDLDTVPFHRIFDYETTPGTVKHYYGFEHSLGGIVVIKGADFEAINGYPNYWSWGLEDSCLQNRCVAAGIEIDRSQFYKIGSPQILHIFDGVSRIINQRDPKRYNEDNGQIGLSTLYGIDCAVDEKSINAKDNIYQAADDFIKYINVKSFESETNFDDDAYFNYDLREPTKNIIYPDPKNQTRNVVSSPESWSNIPFIPTALEKLDMKQEAQIAKLNPQQQQHQQKQNPGNGSIPGSALKVHVKTIRTATKQSVWTQPAPPPQQRPFQGTYHLPLQRNHPNQQQKQLTPYEYRQMNPKNANVAPVKVVNSRLRR